MKTLSILFLLSVTLSCSLMSFTVGTDYLLKCSSEKLECSRDEINITYQSMNEGGFGAFDWVAECRSREYRCDQDQTRKGITCVETDRSRRKTIRRIVIDRLALETNCNKENVKVIQEGAWSRGSETAYRLIACGSEYICSSSNDVTRCKKALSTTKTSGDSE